MDLIAQNREAYDRIAEHFSATRQQIWPEFKEFSAYLKNGQRILDWGCGNGRLLLMLENKKIEYFGVDQSKQLLKQARAEYAKAIKKGMVHFFCNAKRDKKFPPAFFDCAFMIASFFHLPDEKSRVQLLTNIYRELKPGGLLYISVWNLQSAWARLKKKNWKRIAENDFIIPWRDQSGKVLAERYYHHFSRDELVACVERAGFMVQDTHFFSTRGWSDDKGGRNLILFAHKPTTAPRSFKRRITKAG